MHFQYPHLMGPRLGLECVVFMESFTKLRVTFQPKDSEKCTIVDKGISKST